MAKNHTRKPPPSMCIIESTVGSTDIGDMRSYAHRLAYQHEAVVRLGNMRGVSRHDRETLYGLSLELYMRRIELVRYLDTRSTEGTNDE